MLCEVWFFSLVWNESTTRYLCLHPYTTNLVRVRQTCYELFMSEKNYWLPEKLWCYYYDLAVPFKRLLTRCPRMGPVVKVMPGFLPHQVKTWKIDGIRARIMFSPGVKAWRTAVKKMWCVPSKRHAWVGSKSTRFKALSFKIVRRSDQSCYRFRDKAARCLQLQALYVEKVGALKGEFSNVAYRRVVTSKPLPDNGDRGILLCLDLSSLSHLIFWLFRWLLCFENRSDIHQTFLKW